MTVEVIYITFNGRDDSVAVVTAVIIDVADCFLTCGALALMVSTVLFNKELREEKK